MRDNWIMRAFELLDTMDSIHGTIRIKPMNTRTRKTVWKERRRRANLPRWILMRLLYFTEQENTQTTQTTKGEIT